MKNEMIVEDFLEFSQIDAASGNERGVADAVKSKLEALGLVVEEDDAGASFGGNAGNLLAVLDGGLPGSILLNAHMDRVANGLGIKLQIKDDRSFPTARRFWRPTNFREWRRWQKSSRRSATAVSILRARPTSPCWTRHQSHQHRPVLHCLPGRNA